MTLGFRFGHHKSAWPDTHTHTHIYIYLDSDSLHYSCWPDHDSNASSNQRYRFPWSTID
jgi:hypothetical protein